MNKDKLPQEYYLQVDEVWKAFVEQLQKDASMCGINLDTGIFSPDSLQENIQKINDWLKNTASLASGYEKIQSWLYRVDVPEQLIKSKLNQNDDYYHVVAELIVKRTLQKVVIRYLHKYDKL
ncbi:MAG: hypothetical protein KatS3mg028_1322 [Bacteroidia bacterium]|nr:MAG: hypothetical protein KatS3mg028_1322 [Bacteroidia bacterium]